MKTRDFVEQLLSPLHRWTCEEVERLRKYLMVFKAGSVLHVVHIVSSSRLQVHTGTHLLKSKIHDPICR